MSGVLAVSGKMRTVFRVLAYGSLGVILAVFGYALYCLVTQGVGVIGSSLVDVEIPPASISVIYAKPITLLYAASLVFMYTELELIRDRVAKVNNDSLHFYKFLAFFSACIAFFELAYNLIFWSGELAAQAVLGHLNPDTIANPFPDLLHPINVVFATKIASAVLIAGVYIFYYITDIQKRRITESKAPAV